MNRIYMAASLAIRMGVGLIVFVLLARGLGPANFGVVGAIFAYATFASLVTDFGFSTKTLRDIGARPEQGGEILNDSLSVKILLSALVIFCGGAIILFLPVGSLVKCACFFMGSGIVVASVGDLALTSFRALGRFSSETWITSWTSAVYLIAVGSVSMLGGGLFWVAAVFLFSRLVYCVVSVIASRRLFPGVAFVWRSPAYIWSVMRAAVGWSLDAGLGYLNSQIDTLIAVHVLGMASAGIYQAGARFVQASLVLVSVLSNVHVPRLAAHGDVARINRHELRVIWEFVIMAAVVAGAFWIGGPVISHFLLGPQYRGVDVLWLGFSCFVFSRFVASAFGAILSSYAAPWLRVSGQIITLLTILGGLWLARPVRLTQLPWLMAAGGVTTSVVYFCGRLYMVRAARRAA